MTLRQQLESGVEELPRSDSFLESIKRLNHLSKAEFVPSVDGPIFLMAVGWGTGSTLLQRILATDERILVWGEPYGRMGIIPTLTSALSITREKWPKEQFFDPAPEEDEWASPLANFYPDPSSLLNGFRALLEEWLAVPAFERGYERWGVKEVRLSAADAHFLQIIFPNAKFIVLIRDPIRGYQSFRSLRPYWRYDVPVRGARAYGKYWSTMAGEWMASAEGLDFRLIRYEDLISGSFDFRALEDWLDLKLHEDKALAVVTNKKSKKPEPGPIDKWIIRREARESMRQLDYSV